ncbi:DUF1015 family protein [Streptomyces hoynatensis]|uniref:DUF1015 domain-containing protein n=1 Tax=Streptomyces hoynatensis TaxID=1141874 RepID=A0A3A9Z638_9ACTN|nr:DUF1015 domain-containing protein [Streptomyces hoynatensis]RKN43710.1 DUF1015 domain-containing protein [Streptomyces hoynatensis]
MHADGLDLAPFCALRYAPERVGSLAAVTSPPYDVVVRPEEQRALETADPHNVVRLILPRSPGEAAATLARWRAAGVLTHDETPALYVYEQRAPGGRVLQRGLLGALRLTAPEEGVVLPHEDVLPEVVAERAALTRATAANLEPLLLSYRGDGTDPDPGALTDQVAERRPALLALTGRDGTAHRLWRLADPAEQATLARGLARHRALIADGHHRWATSLRLRAEHGAEPPWDRALVLLVDTARHPLRVQAIHRVLPWLPLPEALERACRGGAFRARRLPADPTEALGALDAAEGPALVLAGDGSFHLLDRPDPALLARTVRADRPPAWRALDATVLHQTLLAALWPAPEPPARVAYLHDAGDALAQAERLGGTAALLRAVPERTVRALAERGVTMPQKSTSFTPKPATGLLLRPL